MYLLMVLVVTYMQDNQTVKCLNDNCDVECGDRPCNSYSIPIGFFLAFPSSPWPA